MADVDATFVQKVFDVSKRKRKTDIHHNSQTDDVWASLKVPEWVGFSHPGMLRDRPAPLKLHRSDSALFFQSITGTHASITAGF